MSKLSRIALALSTSALCLGVALAPAAFAAGSTTTDATHSATATHKARASHAKKMHHKKVDKTSAKKPMTAPAAKMHK